MSGQREARFLLDSRPARELRDRPQVAERVEKLFQVRVNVTSNPTQGDLVTLRGGDESIEKAKNYILSMCVPEVIQQWQTTSQSIDQLILETNRLRDSLEREFQTVIHLSSTYPGCIVVKGRKSDVESTISRISCVMAPYEQDPVVQNHGWSLSSHFGPLPPSPPQPPSSQSTYPSEQPPRITTEGTSTIHNSEQQLRVSSHGVASRAATDTQSLHRSSTSSPNAEKHKLLNRIASDIERDGCMLPRSADSAQKEQTIQYFVNLNFPREKTEFIINSMGEEADYDDILRRLNNLCRPPANHNMTKLCMSRPRTFNGEPLLTSKTTLRPVIIDGSNVAMRHGNGRVFSCKGIQLAVQWFKEQGHQQITVFVPQWRRDPPRAEYPITDQEILNQLELEKILSFTPSRKIGNKRIVCYDDRFIVRLATETNGVIVSNDSFRDLSEENEEWRKTIEQRLIMFTFVSDIFMVAEDPLGRHGPSLSQLLQMDSVNVSAKGSLSTDQPGVKICPYGERCTFGKKCRYYHREREGRADSALTPRSATSSPVSERRNTTAADSQKDSAPGSEHISQTGGRKSKSPHKSFSTQLGAELRKPSEPQLYQPELRGYSPLQGGLHCYSQPPNEYLSAQDNHTYNTRPQYLSIVPNSSGPLSPQSPHCQPLHPTTTPLGGGGGGGGGVGGRYARHTFPIANLSVGRPKNMTETIQPVVSPLPHQNDIRGADDEVRNLVPRAPNAHPMAPSPQPHGADPMPGLVPRGDHNPSYTAMPHYHSGSGHDVGSYTGYPQPPYHLHCNAHLPSNSYYLSTEVPASHHQLQHSPGRTVHQNSQPNLHVAPPTTTPYSSTPSLTLQQNHQVFPTVYSSDQRFNSPSVHHQTMPRVPEYRASYPLIEPPSSNSRYSTLSRPSSAFASVGSSYSSVGPVSQDQETYQGSFSSPDLFSSNGVSSRGNNGKVGSSSSSSINWSLFKKAQVVLPDQEEMIMKVMVQNPNLDLDGLIGLIQQS